MIRLGMNLAVAAVLLIKMASVGAYRPSAEVERMHSTAHLDSALEKVDGSFGMHYDDYANSYTDSVQMVPMLMTLFFSCVVLLAAVWLFLSLNFRHFGWSTFPLTPSAYRTSSMTSTSFDDVSIGVKGNAGRAKWSIAEGLPAAIHSHPTIARVAVAVTAGLTFVVANTTFYGDRLVTSGVDYALDESAAAQTTFNAIHAMAVRADSLSVDINTELQAAVASGSCQAIYPMHDLVEALVASADQLTRYTVAVPDAAKEYDATLEYYGRDVKDSTTFLFFGLVLVVCTAVYLSFFHLRNRRSVAMTAGVAHLVAAGFVASSCLVFIATVLGADFCMAPDKYILQMTPLGPTTEVMTFYTMCDGVNPIALRQQQTYNLSLAIDQTTAVLLTDPRSCPEDAHLTKIRTDAQTICTQLDAMDDSLRCIPLRTHLLGSVQDGLCDDMFRGTHSLYSAQVAAGVGMVILGVVLGLSVHSMPEVIVSKKGVVMLDEEPLVLITDSRDYRADLDSLFDDVEMDTLDFSNDLDSHVRNLLD
jgi:hypothetical protein